MAVLHCPQSCVSSASDLCSAWPCIALTLYLYSLNPVLAQPLTCADLHSLLLLVTCLSFLFSPFSLISSCSTFLPYHLITLIISSMLRILAYVLPCVTMQCWPVLTAKGMKPEMMGTGTRTRTRVTFSNRGRSSSSISSSASSKNDSMQASSSAV